MPVSAPGSPSLCPGTTQARRSAKAAWTYQLPNRKQLAATPAHRRPTGNPLQLHRGTSARLRRRDRQPPHLGLSQLAVRRPHGSEGCKARRTVLRWGVPKGRTPAHNVPMHETSGHPLPRDNQGLRLQQVQLSRGHWRREDAAGAISSARWRESVTVTWSAAPAPDRRPAIVPRALAAVAGMMAPVLAEVAVASTRRLLQRRDHRRLVGSLLRRQPVSADRALPRSGRYRKSRVPDMPGLAVALATRRPETRG